MMQYIRLYLQNGKTSAKNFRHVALCKQKTSPRNPGTRINTRFFEERETGIEPATPTLARLYSTTEPLAHKLKTKYELFVKAL